MISGDHEQSAARDRATEAAEEVTSAAQAILSDPDSTGAERQAARNSLAIAETWLTEFGKGR